ncbi:MAG: hypothetical protein N2444_05750 [Methylocystis sp.]|nr:hypothetical protein [Methylocystis sp.]
MNALFFQDGDHPSPLFAAHAPPAGATETARANVGADAVKAAEPAPGPALKPSALESMELARLAGDPTASLPKPGHVVAKGVKLEAVTSAPDKPAAAAKPATAKPAAAKTTKETAKAAPALAPAPTDKGILAKAASAGGVNKTAATKPAAAKQPAHAARDDVKTVATTEAPHDNGPLSLISRLFGGAQPKAAPAPTPAPEKTPKPATKDKSASARRAPSAPTPPLPVPAAR